MKLDYLMTYEATLKPAQPIGRGPFGNRQIAEVTGGRFEGPRLEGELLSGGGTEFGDSYFMTQPRFETGDECYAWLNRLVTVGQGRLLPGAVACEVYACVNG